MCLDALLLQNGGPAQAVLSCPDSAVEQVCIWQISRISGYSKCLSVLMLRCYHACREAPTAATSEGSSFPTRILLVFQSEKIKYVLKKN